MTDKESIYDDSFYCGRWLREMRHNKVLMTPVALIFFAIFGLVAAFNLVMTFPGVILGFILAPVLKRNAYYIEFLYPWAVAKWGHFFLANRGQSKEVKKSDKNRGFHSRTIEQKVEVVPGRVYIHPIPQFGDNLGYLVVCLPAKQDKIVAFMVDCGQADSTVRAIELIQEFHYKKKKIEIQSVLCTHKHHDHTGGTLALMQHKSDMGKSITRVFGGAVERVPECTDFVANGDILELPRSNSNDMNLLVEVEVIAVPAHTRGSVVFRLRPKISGHSEFLFMGDAMFSGGAGVPFEADMGQETEKFLNKATGNTFFRGGIGPVAVERAFAEILSRTMPHDNSVESLERILIFTGHEYTSELLARQFNAQMESCRWRLFSPKDFFETAAQLYTAIHRRSLPHNTGKLLNIPSPLSREIYINPNFRSMKLSAVFVMRAINFWYDNFCKFKATPALRDQEKEKKKKYSKKKKPEKTPSQTKSWILDAENFSRSPFTTVYTEDLEEVIKGIESGKYGKKEGASKLREITRKLDDPVVNKRPIPGFLPSDKNIWRGVSGLARLGSKISGMTLSDSQTMKTAPPIDSNSDRILVSLQRLLLVLGRLGFLETPEGEDLSYRVKQLFREASVIMKQEFDAEMVETQDEIELGVLKWMLYGIESAQLSCIAKTCCITSEAKPREFPPHPGASHFKKKVGELVSHDVYTCKICRHATGCFDVSQLDNPDEKHAEEEQDETPSDELGLEIPVDGGEPEIREPKAPRNKKSETDETRTDSDSRSQSETQQRSEGVEVHEKSVNGVESFEVQDTSVNGADVESEKQAQQDEEELSDLVNQLTIEVGVDGEEDTEVSLDGRRE